MTRRITLALTLGLIGLMVFPGVTGCETVEKAGPQPTAAKVTKQLHVPRVMQGTVASETTILGYPQAGDWATNNVVVRGFGLVVGLKNTGSREVPPALRAHMRADMTKHGIGVERAGWGDLNPETLLNSLETAVVVVEGVIPPGSPEGAPFDVRVYADPRTGTTSLEGGRLYTTELRPGALQVGGKQAFALAEARGELFINPFAEPGAVGRDTVNRTIGIIIHGGSVKKDMPIKLQLIHPSHIRAQRIQNVINTRFPKERGQKDPTARGQSDELIALTIPPSYRGRTDEFVALLQHTTLRLTNAQSVANTVKRSLVANPGFAAAAALRWEALGKPALPVVRTLYDYRDERPRLAALTAGARLDDGLVVSHLIQMSRSGSSIARRQSIELLSKMRFSPQIDNTLRMLVNDEDVDVRLSAYEALARRNDPTLHRVAVDDKFLVDVVDSDYPMLYVTQTHGPKLVVFGRDLAIEQPLTMATWSSRFMLKGNEGDKKIEVYYRSIDQVTGDVAAVDPNIGSFVQFLGHNTTIESPAPGLDFTYSETIGVLHQIWSQKFIDADFKADQDRVLAAITRRENKSDVVDRPELSEPGTRWFTPDGSTGGDSDDSGVFDPAPFNPPASGSASADRP